MTVKKHVCFWLVGAMALGTSSAWTQQSSESTPIDEIIVTAQRRTEDLQRAAASIDVRQGHDLIEQGRYSLSSIIEDVPGLSGGAASTTAGAAGSSAGTDSPAAGLIIRGIPSNAGAGADPVSIATSAAMYVDGVYSGVGGGYDIDRVEVLRGPQGTLYGRSATTGVVSIHTSNPDLDHFGAGTTVESGNYDLQHYTGNVNVPIVDGQLGLRLSGNYYDRDGYISQGDAQTNKDYRLKLLYQPNKDLSVLLGYANEENTQYSGGATLNLVSPDHYVRDDSTLTNPVGEGTNRFRQYWAELNWSLGELSLTYLPSYRTWESDAFNRPRYGGGTLGSDQYIRTPTDEFITHEFRLASSDQGPLTWQIGGLYYHNEIENHELALNPFANDSLQANSDTSKRTKAVGEFGEATYAFTDDWRVTAGLRHDQTEVDTMQTYTTPFGTVVLSGDEGYRKFNNTTYKLRLEHDLTRDNLLYLLTSTGFVPGDVAVTTGPSGSPTIFEFDAETLTSYEIGSKNRFFDNLLRANAAAFFYDFGAYQLANIAVAVINGSPSFASMSAPARTYGAELELILEPSTHDRIGFNMSYTHGEFRDRDQQVVQGTGHTFDYYISSSSIPNIVPVQAQLSYDHDLKFAAGSALTFRAALRYKGAYEMAPVSQSSAEGGAYAYMHANSDLVGDLSANWTSSNEHFSVAAYVRNVGDHRNKAGGSIVDQGPGVFSATTLLTDPRTFGIVLSAKM